MLDYIRLSNILFIIDPAHTCCKENDLDDEYDGIALAISSEIKTGEVGLPEALQTLWVEYFDQHLNPDLVSIIVREYSRDDSEGN